jgi:drug/metabolite transporter (DMT)-like permease
MSARPRIPSLHVMLLIALALVWGSSFILMKRAMKTPDEQPLLSPAQVASMRMFFAGLTLIPFVPSAMRVVRKADWPWLLVVGLCGSGVPAFLFTRAQMHIDSSVAGMLNALTPLFTVIVGVLAFRSAFSARQVTGVVIGLAGAVTLLLLTGVEKHSHIGWALLVVLATACYGVSVNTIQHKLSHLNGLQTASLSMLLVAIPCGVIALMTSPVEVIRDNPYGLRALGAVVILGAVGSALANALFFRLTHRTSALFAASVTYLIPIVAVGWGIMDDEPLSIWHVAAGGIILVGVWLMRSRKAKSTES